LFWDISSPVSTASASLVVVRPPVVDELYFWALQVTFEDGAGAHVGLQWLPGAGAARRAGPAANWGGYEAGGRELAGSPPGNTHPYPWVVGRQYSLSVVRGSVGWMGRVSDGAGTVFERELLVGGHTLSSPMVWSEVFARCDHPSVMVRWSSLRVDGVEVRRARAKYQADGCTNTDSSVDGDGFVQTTCTERRTPQGGWLEVEA
jgi:hypothetical protein